MPDSPAARAKARAAAVDRDMAKYLRLDCGHYQVRDALMQFKAPRGYKGCDICGEDRRIVRGVRGHPEGCPGCGWCVEDPRELF